MLRNRILLIEDSKFMAAAIGRALGSAGYIVRTTGDGDRGKRLARSTQPDVIILDMVFQGSSGLEILQAI
jgi:DNA-binding response OmpR family regulator